MTRLREIKVEDVLYTCCLNPIPAARFAGGIVTQDAITKDLRRVSAIS